MCALRISLGSFVIAYLILHEECYCLFSIFTIYLSLGVVGKPF